MKRTDGFCLTQDEAIHLFQQVTGEDLQKSGFDRRQKISDLVIRIVAAQTEEDAVAVVPFWLNAELIVRRLRDAAGIKPCTRCNGTGREPA